MVRWTAREIASDASEHNIMLVLVFNPVLGKGASRRVIPEKEVLDIFQENGFLLINLRGAYDVENKESLQVAPFDRHPNAKANRLIADRLTVELCESKELLRKLNERQQLINQ